MSVCPRSLERTAVVVVRKHFANMVCELHRELGLYQCRDSNAVYSNLQALEVYMCTGISKQARM